MEISGILQRRSDLKKTGQYGMTKLVVNVIASLLFAGIAAAENPTVKDLVEMWKEKPGDMYLLALLPLSDSEDSYDLVVRIANEHNMEPNLVLRKDVVDVLSDLCREDCELAFFQIGGTLFVVDHLSKRAMSVFSPDMEPE